MIKILDDTKDLSLLVNDKTNGLGQIACVDGTVDEVLNGLYEAEFSVSTSEKHFDKLQVGGLVKIPLQLSEQIFRIYYISKPFNDVVTVKAQHITYDLAKIPVKPFEATGAVNAKNGMLNKVIGNYPFTMETNINNTSSKFTLDIPRSFRECLGGYEGSLLDVFRGEYEWDNLTVKMLSRRGSDNGVRIAYGKNLTDFKQEENNESVYDAVLAYAVVDDKAYVASQIYNKTGAEKPKVLIKDFSNQFEQEAPTDARLIELATNYATGNDIEVPNVNLTISFVPLYQTEEYRNVAPLERVFLGDTVHVFFDKLGVEASARVIRTKWNVNLQRYDSIELGSAKANLNTVINSAVDEGVDKALSDLNIDTSFLENSLDNLSALIVNGLGLHITKDEAGRYYLHNAEKLEESQYQYVITAQGFMMSDDYGQTWNSGWSTSGDAVMNSLSTITLKALEVYGSFIYGTQIQGSTITFGDRSDKYVEAKPNSNSGVIFQGNGTIFISSQGAMTLSNYNSSNRSQNGLYLSGANTETNTARLVNSAPDTTTDANTITLISNDSRQYCQSSYVNKNYKSTKDANTMTFYSSVNNNNMTLVQCDSDGNYKNQIQQFYDKTDGSSMIYMNTYKKVGNGFMSSAGLRISDDGIISLFSDNSYNNCIKVKDRTIIFNNDGTLGWTS